MGRNLDKIINSLPAKRQTKIAAISKQKVEEMIAQAATLSDFRNAVERNSSRSGASGKNGGNYQSENRYKNGAF